MENNLKTIMIAKVFKENNQIFEIFNSIIENTELKLTTLSIIERLPFVNYKDEDLLDNNKVKIISVDDTLLKNRNYYLIEFKLNKNENEQTISDIKIGDKTIKGTTKIDKDIYTALDRNSLYFVNEKLTII